MSFEFRDANNIQLTSTSIRSLVSTLVQDGEITLSVYTTEATNKPGIYLSAATSMGDIRYPAESSSYSDYSDLLHFGSNTNTPSGLKVVVVENNVEEEVFFTFSAGATVSNKILLPQLFELPAESNVLITLKYTSNPEIDAKRFYVGVNIDDS